MANYNDQELAELATDVAAALKKPKPMGYDLIISSLVEDVIEARKTIAELNTGSQQLQARLDMCIKARELLRDEISEQSLTIERLNQTIAELNAQIATMNELNQRNTERFQTIINLTDRNPEIAEQTAAIWAFANAGLRDNPDKHTGE